MKSNDNDHDNYDNDDYDDYDFGDFAANDDNGPSDINVNFELTKCSVFAEVSSASTFSKVSLASYLVRFAFIIFDDHDGHDDDKFRIWKYRSCKERIRYLPLQMPP